MCGIVGIIGSNPSEQRINLMLDRVKHRGPDGVGLWKDNNIELGHVRLSIIDLSDQANQPMFDPETGNVLIFNGEIYNYIEIKKELSSKYKFRTTSDTEVILAAYQVYGELFLDHLRGMFALALFDKKKNKTLIARDRFGIKPLYYRFFEGTFLFASEIKALINLNKHNSETINESKAYEFLANRQLDCNEETLFKEVFQLLPAHYAWVNNSGGIEPSKEYWTFPVVGEKPFDLAAEEELRDEFRQAIELHLRSDVPLGTFLSGGLDSSSVTCFALNSLEQPVLHTFSAILPYFHAENSLISEVTNAHNRIVPHDFLLNGDDFFADIPKVIFHHDEPILDGSMYAHYKLCALAKENKIKVLLSGSGGDELFGGYSSYVHAQNANFLSHFQLLEYLKNIVETKGNSALPVRTLLFKSIYECLPIGFRRKVKNIQLNLQNKHVAIQKSVPHFHFEHNNLYYENMLNNYKSWTVPPYLHYEDRNSMAFGVETRVPFLDHKLLEFVLQFESKDIVKGRSKNLMRKAFKGIVPAAILNQKGKYGFPSPIDHALRGDSQGRELFFDLFKDTPFLKNKQTEQIGIDFYNGKNNLTIFWRTLSYILWHQIFFKQWKGYI